MSHYTEVSIPLNDKEGIIAALSAAYNCDKSCIKISDKGDIPLYGYGGDNRSILKEKDPNYAPTCDIVLSKKYVGTSANDIGFKKQADGTYKAYISDYDKSAWKEKESTFKQTYGIHKVKKAAQKNKWKQKGEIVKKLNGELVLKFSKNVYRKF